MTQKKSTEKGYQPAQEGYQPEKTTTTTGDKVQRGYQPGYQPETSQGGTQSNPPKKQ